MTSAQRHSNPVWKALVALAALMLVVASCGASDEAQSSSEPGAEAATDDNASSEESADDAGSEAADAPTDDEAANVSIAVTTNILGDVVNALVGDQADVFVVMPVGADPHDFQASAQEVDQLLSADLVVANGAGFEEGLEDVIDSARADGVNVVDAIDFVETIEFGAHGGGHDDHGDDDHGDDDHGDEEHGDDHGDEKHGDEEGHDDHDHEGVDPHFFTDPGRMLDAVTGVSAALAEVDGIDSAALKVATDAYLAELTAVDAAFGELLLSIPEDRRVLVTNHEVFGYVAERFDFEVVGVVVPGGSTTDAVSPGELAELAEEIRNEAVPAIFVDTSSPTALAETLAGEVGDIEIVELYTESLGDDGEGDSYLEMVKANAERIAAALG